MKVALVGTHPSKRGRQPSDDRLATLAGALARRGVDVTVFSCRADPSGPDLVDTDAGYRIVYMPGRGSSDAELAPAMGDFARFLADQWAADRPDLVHATTWIYGVAAQLAADHLGIASVQSLPELSGAVHRRQGRHIGPATRVRFERLLARSATRVVTSCTDDVSELVRLGCPRTRISVLPQAIDMEHFSPIGPEPGGQHGRIIAVARELLPHKGLDDLIRAMPALPEAELVIVGGPPGDRLDRDAGAASLRRLAIDTGVTGRVHLTGQMPRDRLPAMLRSADVLACPSWYEPFGLPVVEAMACGIPVVASHAGGMIDTVIHEVTGVLVPPRDQGRLAKALGGVLRGGALRSGMGLAGRTRATSRYSWERVAAEAHTLYERTAGEFTARRSVPPASNREPVSS